MEIYGWNIFLLLLGLIGTVMSAWGTQTRGTWSPAVAIIGGILWLIAVVSAFIVRGFPNGLYFLLGTFVLGFVATRIFPKR